MRNYILFVTFLFLLVGCESKEVMTEPLEVILLTDTTLISSTNVIIQVQILQGEETVDDAYSIKFEIWQEDLPEHELIDAVHQGNGIYQIEKNFLNNGQYHCVIHTTARDIHLMPEYIFEVIS